MCSNCPQLLEEPVEVIGNALELRAFDRMEEDIRLIGYFKNEDSERECAAAEWRVFETDVFFYFTVWPLQWML